MMSSDDKFKQTQSTSTSESETIDLKGLIGLFMGSKWLILTIVVVMAFFGGVYCLSRTPTYESNTLINVSNKGSNALESSVLSTMSFEGFSRTSAVTTESEILKTRAVLLPVIRKMRLNIEIQPIYFPILGHHMAHTFEVLHPGQVGPVKFGMKQYNWGGAELKVDQFTVPARFEGKPFLVRMLSPSRYALFFQKTYLAEGEIGQALTAQLPTGEMITLSVSYLRGNPGTEFYIRKLNDLSIMEGLSTQLKVTETDKLASTVTLSLQGKNPILISNILNAIDDSAQTESIHQKSQQAAKTLSFLEAQIPAVENKLIQAESALNQYKAQSGNVDIRAQGTALLHAISTIQAQITSLEVQQQSLESQYTDESYQIQSITTQINALKTQRQKLEASIRAIPNADQELMQLQRNVAIQNAVYTKLLSNLQQFELLKEGTIGNVQIIDPAFVPYLNINKPSSVIVTLCVFLGLILSAMIIFLRQYLFRGIEDPQLIEDRLAIPVFGTLHESKTQFKQLQRFKRGVVPHLSILEELDPSDITVESFRSLRTNILFELAKTNNQVIAISGPVPNVGKSFVSVNIAAALAESNKRVLLIDGDIRKGDIYQYFKDQRYPGLCDLLVGNSKIEDCIHHTRIHHLDFMPTGRLPKRHTQILMSKSFDETITFLKQQYDVIVIDTAPVLAVTDAFIIGKLAGIRLLVTAWGKHDEKELLMTKARYDKAGLDITGCVFNLIKVSNSAFSYRYQYAYKYSAKKPSSHEQLETGSDQEMNNRERPSEKS